MKTIVNLIKATCVASLCLAGLSIKAQYISDFYHFNGTAADHGQGAKVITTQAPVIGGSGVAAAAYVVAGTSNAAITYYTSAAGGQSVFLSEYDASGNNVWHRNFSINQGVYGATASVQGLTEAKASATPGYGVLAYTNSSLVPISASPAQSVLMRTDANGVLLWKTEVGSEKAASLAYDNNLDRFLVLTQVNNVLPTGAAADEQLQLVVIDATSGAIIYTRYFDGLNKSKDQAAAVLYDAGTASYILIGSSTWTPQFGGTAEQDLLIVRLNSSGTTVYTHVFGMPAVEEVAVGATLIPNQLIIGIAALPNTGAQVAITGTLTGKVDKTNYTQQPYFALIDIPTGTFTTFNVLNKNFMPQAITYAAGTKSLVIAGNKANAATGEADAYVTSVDPASGGGEIHNYTPAFAVNSFADVATGTGGNVVLTGAHKTVYSWLGSPGNQQYNWLVTAASTGAGECDTKQTIAAEQYATGIWASNTSGTVFTSFSVTVTETQQTETSADACTYAYRTESSGSTSNTLPVNGGVHVFPNPASDHLNVEYSASSNDNVEIHIINMTGKVVLSQKLESGAGSSSISTSDLAPGAYFSDMIINGTSVQKNKLTILTK
jgi:hypothetical protein